VLYRIQLDSNLKIKKTLTNLNFAKKKINPQKPQFGLEPALSRFIDDIKCSILDSVFFIILNTIHFVNIEIKCVFEFS